MENLGRISTEVSTGVFQSEQGDHLSARKPGLLRVSQDVNQLCMLCVTSSPCFKGGSRALEAAAMTATRTPKSVMGSGSVRCKLCAVFMSVING